MYEYAWDHRRRVQQVNDALMHWYRMKNGAHSMYELRYIVCNWHHRRRAWYHRRRLQKVNDALVPKEQINEVWSREDGTPSYVTFHGNKENGTASGFTFHGNKEDGTP